MRIASLQVPLFPLAARLRSEPELRGQPLVILAGSGTNARVVAASRPARHAGIGPGLTMSQVHSRLPELVARFRDDECERSAREALLEIAESFSPRIEDVGEGLIFLDLAGLERLNPDEVELGRALMLAADRHAGLPIRVGIAGSKLAAQIAAGRPHSPTVVTNGDEAAFLAPLPLTELAPSDELLRTFSRWGIHSLGEFARLPKAEVVSRLGPAGQDLQAIARGSDPRPLVPYQPPQVFCEGMDMEWPLVSLEPFLFVARAALERLVRRMESHSLGCSRLQLSLTLEPDGHHDRSLQLPAPTRDVKTLLTLVRLELERHPPGAPVVGFLFSAHPDRPRGAQLSLFGPKDLSPDKLATTLGRLFALLGKERVGTPEVVDSHRPEAVVIGPFTPPRSPRHATSHEPSTTNSMAVRVLRPPLPLEVIVDDESHQRPVAMTSTVHAKKTLRIDGRIRVASGPWDLESEWWTEEPRDRRYWDVELSDGALYRVFRDVASGDWFADGMYD